MNDKYDNPDIDEIKAIVSNIDTIIWTLENILNSGALSDDSALMTQCELLIEQWNHLKEYGGDDPEELSNIL